MGRRQGGTEGAAMGHKRWQAWFGMKEDGNE